MNINFHVHESALTDVDNYSGDHFHWVMFTEWSNEESGLRSISYQVSLYFEAIKDVDRVIHALTQLKEHMHGKDLIPSTVDRGK